jgi:hypothetical protein
MRLIIYLHSNIRAKRVRVGQVAVCRLIFKTSWRQLHPIENHSFAPQNHSYPVPRPTAPTTTTPSFWSIHHFSATPNHHPPKLYLVGKSGTTPSTPKHQQQPPPLKTNLLSPSPSTSPTTTTNHHYQPPLPSSPNLQHQRKTRSLRIFFPSCLSSTTSNLLLVASFASICRSIPAFNTLFVTRIHLLLSSFVDTVKIAVN